MVTRDLGRGLPRRRVGMRLWLGAAFAGVAFITAASIYVFVDDSSNRTLRSQAADLAVGRTFRLADELSGASKPEARKILTDARSDQFLVFALTPKRRPIARVDPPVAVREIEGAREAIRKGLSGQRFRRLYADNRTVAAAPIVGPGGIEGVVVSSSLPPPVLSRVFDDLRSDSLRALAIAVAIGVLVGFIVSSLISIRVKRLARAAERMTAGRFDAPLPAGGGDEIGDLTRSLDTMRQALRETFEMLATERDRLSAILDGLNEAVIVVGEDGAVRFTNPAAGELIRDGQPPAALIPVLRNASERGSDQVPVLVIEGRVYGVQARRVTAEHAVLLVVRDRTEELKRERAEREFVSNAAHELRNPLAGISGSIEVLRGGAKDDPEARERFLDRLAEDAQRMTRLTQSLLVLARVEAVGEREIAQVVDVSMAAREATEAVEAPSGVEVVSEVGPELVAEGDPVLLHQVLIGLLSNACKNTEPPGTVTLRASAGEGASVTIEVEDTGKGIPPEEQERVFERFYRGSHSLGGDGFGLGLSIAKRMVDVMGGEIGLRSTPGRGSTFWVRLRAPKPSPTPVA
jgi:two-component system, OmpR family, phosphate regulon sensor histidine kinase PhoR